jgi:2-polyprenyl-3-methyl-5-hydroxy-6-metoxy-1,4-benzoquinol methylase
MGSFPAVGGRCREPAGRRITASSFTIASVTRAPQALQRPCRAVLRLTGHGSYNVGPVPGCCDPRGCDRFFNRRMAHRAAERYRKRGLNATSRRMVEFLDRGGLAGTTVLEVGGGVGEIQLELLKRGARRTINLELSPAYEHEAERLLRDAGVEGRVERRLHDIAVDPGDVERADVVVLNRVVCCYPDYERLLGAAADHAGRRLVFSHPPRNPISRAVVAAQNLVFRLMPGEFRTFAHPPAAMRAVLERHGLKPTFAHRGVPWQIAGFER